MAKISALPQIVAPSGTETVVAVDRGGNTGRAPLGDLVGAAVAPAVARAELAAAVASGFVGGVIFETVAQGIAAVADGAAFTVAGTGTTYARLYRRRGSAATELGSIYSKAGIDDEIGGRVIELTADLYLPEFAPRSRDRYVLRDRVLTIGRMHDTGRTGLFDNAGGGRVEILDGIARPEWWTTKPLRSAAHAVEGHSGQVLAEGADYAPEFTAAAPLTAAYVTFQGAGEPEWGPGSTRLVGGTRFRAPFIVTATGFRARDAGFDGGADVCAANWNGTPQEVFGLIVPDHSKPLAEPYRRVELTNVKTLAHDGAGYAVGGSVTQSGVHCCLVEGAIQPRISNVSSRRGANGIVLKTRDAIVQSLSAAGHSVNPVIIKSDIYAPAIGNTVVDARVECLAPNDTGPMRIESASADAARNALIAPRIGAGVTGGISLEAARRRVITDTVIEGHGIEAVRFFGITVSPRARRTKIIGGITSNVLDSGAPHDFGHAIDIAADIDVAAGIADRAQDTEIIGHEATNVAGHGIKNAGVGTKVIGGAVSNAAKSGYFGTGQSDMRLIGARGTVGSDTPGAVRGGRQGWTPVLNGDVVIVANGGRVDIAATCTIVDGVAFVELVFTPTGGATIASRAGAVASGLPLGGNAAPVTAAFASTRPSIPTTGFFDGIGNAYLPTWAATSDPVILSWRYTLHP